MMDTIPEYIIGVKGGVTGCVPSTENKRLQVTHTKALDCLQKQSVHVKIHNNILIFMSRIKIKVRLSVPELTATASRSVR